MRIVALSQSRFSNFYIRCFVIVNIRVIFVCCFASVRRKQVYYHSLYRIYAQHGGRVRPLLVYQIWSGKLYSFRSYKGVPNFVIGSHDLGHAHLRVFLSSTHRNGLYSISVPNLKQQIAHLVQKLIRFSKFRDWVMWPGPRPLRVRFMIRT